MDNAADTLVLGDRFYLLGAAQLSAGNLVVKGDFVQDNWGPSTFAASGTHTTIFSGASAQHLQMPANASSYFNNLRIDNAAGVDIDNDVDIRGQLQGVGGGVIRTTTGRTLNVSGGLRVLGLVLDGTPLNVNGGLLQRFDNVVFRNFPPGQPAQMRIRHAGGTAFTMNNISFLTAPMFGGLWVDADDTDPATPALTLDITSPQWMTGTQNTNAGSAVVTWRMTP
jgi:hypothetical protein